MKAAFTLCWFVFISFIGFAQRTAFYQDPELSFKLGLELLDKKQYSESQKHFQDYLNQKKLGVHTSDATYYSAVCALELFNKDGEWQMKNFVAKFPSSNWVTFANFNLGKSNFRKKKYSESLEFFDKTDIYKLSKEQLAEFYFKRGYSYLQTNEDNKALADFFEIKEVENKYQFPATYYHSHISYEQKNYEIALKGFNKLIGNETFGSVVPYYITQIYFIQGKFDKVIKEAPKLLKDSINIQKEGEINRMIGESYFNLKDYSNALTFLTKTELGSGLNIHGNYILGYCCYKAKDYKKAATNFMKALDNKDSIAQNAYYHLSDCFIKLNEKLKAKNASYNASQLNFDKKIAEDALFNFAKLSYELDFSPYNEAVKSFGKYLKQYPNSPRREEAYKYLINVYSTTKNYAQAINSIESLGEMSPALKYTYQKLNYFKGVEFFNNGDLDNAEKQFTKSLSQNTDFKLNALNQYWLAEISFLRKDYSTAINLWKKFQLLEGSASLAEYDLSNYALGYAYFLRKDKDDYTNANISFRKFLLTKNKYDENKTVDSYIRAADCYFMNRDFVQASEYYKSAINLNKLDVDYSLFQKALCDGLSKKYEEKVNELKKIETSFPNSNYLSASLNEIADTYFNNLKDEENAIIYYERILKNYPNSSFANNSLAQLGNIYFARKNDEKAFEYYDRFVKADTKSDAAKEVLESIKKIFEAKGNVEEMEQYFVSVGNPLSENQLEKATYIAAYDAYYTQKSCELASTKWETYINKFPNGKYITEAQFCSAECAYSKGLNEKALTGYLYVIDKPRGIYTEVSLTKASFLLFKDKKYKETLPIFIQLQDIAETPANKNAGKIGAMRCAYYLNDFETALTECVKVINIEKITPQQLSEAKYIKAKSLYETNRLDDAMLEFKAMTKSAKNLSGAEAYYYIAKIHFSKNNYKEVENTITKLVSYEYSNDEWNSKGLLLLADAYLAKGDDSDAEVVLQTLIDTKPKEEILNQATERMNKLIEKQKKQKQQQQQSSAPSADLILQGTTNKKDSLLYNNLIQETIKDSTSTNKIQ